MPTVYAGLWLTLFMQIIQCKAQANPWQQLSLSGSTPTPRAYHSAVWCPAASAMLVFGGNVGSGLLNDLLAYYPEANTWQQLFPSGSAPTARYGHSAVWSSAGAMLVFGGYDSGRLNDVHAYYPEAHQWQQLRPSGSAPTARLEHSAVWSPAINAMLIFGGHRGGEGSRLSDLHAYYPEANTWQQLSPSGSAPTARYAHSAVWCNATDAMLVFGGYDGSAASDLHAYYPEANAWQQVPTGGSAPTPRSSHSAVWSSTAGVMLVFGGRDFGGQLNDLYAYDPEAPAHSEGRDEVIIATLACLLTFICLVAVVTIYCRCCHQHGHKDGETSDFGEVPVERASRDEPPSEKVAISSARFEGGEIKCQLSRTSSGHGMLPRNNDDGADILDEHLPSGKGSRVAMFSARFDGGEIEQTFRSVHSILLRNGYDVLMVSAAHGDDFGALTLKYLHRLKEEDGVMLAVCTPHYGEVTASKFSSNYELKYAMAYGIKVLPLRTHDQFPPRPPAGPQHRFDAGGAAQSYIDGVFMPGVVRLDCRRRSDKEIAWEIALRLNGPWA